eukprot:128184_1
MGSLLSILYAKRWIRITSSVVIMFYLFPRLRRYYRRYRVSRSKYKPKIVIIGAGFSGIMNAIKLQELGYDNYIILERHNDVGGTWYTNVYPGIACDVPSYLYSFSFQQKYNWSKEYSPQQEILQYIKSVAIKYDIMKYIRFNSDAKYFKYNEQKCEWTIDVGKFDDQTAQPIKMKCNIIIACMGGLTTTNLKYPYSNQQISKFKNITMHSGKWDTSYSFKNKKVAIIGSGASALQILPIVQKQCKQLYTFQRSPTYIYPKRDWKISKLTHLLYYYFPVFMYLRRLLLYCCFECIVYPLLLKKNKRYHKIAIAGWKQHRDHPKYGIPQDTKYDYIRDAVTPKGFTPGCKRIGASNEWYPALCAGNTEFIVNTKDSKNCIVDFYDKGIILKDDRKIEVDCIVFCTGYEVEDVSKFKGANVFGKNNKSLKVKWSTPYGPYGYKGILLSDFPNYFVCLGVGSGVGSNSFITCIEIGSGYIMKCITDMMIYNYKSVEIKKEIEDEYNRKMDERMKDMIWTQKERSWYKLKNGRVHALFGYSMETWWWYLRRPIWSEFNIKK